MDILFLASFYCKHYYNEQSQKHTILHMCKFYQQDKFLEGDLLSSKADI